MIKFNSTFSFFSILLIISGLFNYYFVLNKYEYLIYILFIFISVVYFAKKILLPRSYLSNLIAFILITLVNYLITPYLPNFLYFVIGLIFTLLPFFHYILSYNYKFDDKQIITLIDTIVKFVLIIDCISILETYIFRTAVLDKRLIGTSIFWFQYLASFNNQALVLSLALFRISDKKKYLYMALLFALYAILTLQLKTYIGLLVILLCYQLVYNQKNIVIRLVRILPVTILAFVGLMQIDLISTKVNTYVDLYYLHTDGIARNELYNASIQIAVDKFPLGTGQGTFGSMPVNMYDSRVYYDYHIDNVYGLSKYHDVNFKMDTHWSSILGENGVLGTILYLLLFIHPIRYVSRYKNNFRDYYFIILACIIALMIESIVLNLASRLTFIMIYSGLTGIIVRRISDNNKATVII